MEKVFDIFSGMMVEKGQESEAQKTYDAAKVQDKSGTHEVVYIDIDGQKSIKTINGSVQEFDNYVQQLKSHGCKIIKQTVYKNWDNKTVHDSVYEVTVITKENKHEKQNVTASSIEEAENKVKTDGTIVNVRKVHDKDDAWQSASLKETYRAKRGGTYYIFETKGSAGSMIYLITKNKDVNHGGVVEFSLSKAKEWAEHSDQMSYLEKKYGKSEGYKKWMAEGMAADKNTVDTALKTLDLRYEGYEIKNVAGHVEYFKNGEHKGSADDLAEAKRDIDEEIKPKIFIVQYEDSRHNAAHQEIKARNLQEAEKIGRANYGKDFIKILSK